MEGAQKGDDLQRQPQQMQQQQRETAVSIIELSSIIKQICLLLLLHTRHDQ
jgi:hypothetical protein